MGHEINERAPPPSTHVGPNDEYLRGYSDAVKEGSKEREWMTHKAWMDAVLMLVHYTENAKRTWLVGHQESARKRDEWWDRCKTLSATKSAEDIEALTKVANIERCAEQFDRIASIIDRNLYRQHEKVEDAKSIAIAMREELRAAVATTEGPKP